MKSWVYIACAVILFFSVGSFICGLIAFTPLGSQLGRKWQYGGSMGVGRLSPFPDQSAIAYSSSHSGTSHIYTIGWGGRTIRQLTDDVRADSDVCVSPTGNFIVFARQDGDSVHLWVMNPDGTGRKQLTFGPGSQTEPAISHGGGKIAYVESSPAAGAYAIAVMNAAGTRRAIMTGGSTQTEDTTPVFDPTGTRIYFSRYQSNGSNRMGIWAINITGKAEQFIGAGNHPAVSPDGKQIVFFDTPQNQTLGVMNMNGTERSIIRQQIGYGRCLRYCPNGQNVLILTSDYSKGNVSSVHPDGTGSRRIVTLE